MQHNVRIILSLFGAMVLLVTLYLLITAHMLESFRQDEAHMIAHFGGTPNNSQIWPHMVKYPKQYV